MSDRSIQVSQYINTLFLKVWDKFWYMLGATALIALPATILGVDPKLILVLVALFVADFFTGILKAVATGQSITSRRAFDGVIKGALYFIFIIASWTMTQIFKEYIPLHIGAVTFTALIEFRSVLENIRDANVNIPLLSQILDFVDAKVAQVVSLIQK